jgi:hypothetical protein
MNHIDSLNAGDGEGGQVSAPEQTVDYYFFYKDNRKSSKAAKKQLEID